MFQKIKENMLKNPIYFFSIYFLFSLKPKLEFFFPSVVELYKYFHYGLILWGIILILYHHKYLMNYFYKEIHLSMLLFFVSIGITIVYNFQYITVESIKTSILTIFVTVLFLPAYEMLTKKVSAQKTFKMMFLPAFILKFLISFTAIILYAFNISIFIIDNNNLLYYAGVRYVELADKSFTVLLYGLYSDPNYSAVYSMAFLFIGLFYWFKFGIKSTVYKYLFWLFMATEFIVFSLNNSRGAELAVYVSVAYYILLSLVRLCSKNNNKKTTLKNIGKLSASIVLFFGLNYTVKLTTLNILELNEPVRLLIRNQTNEVITLGKTSEAEILKQYVSTIEEVGINLKQIKTNTSVTKQDSTKEIGNGRIRIWRAALKLTKKSPFFGFGPSMQSNAARRFPDIEVGEMYSGRAFHNSFILLYFSFGALGFITLGLWFVRVFYGLSKQKIRESQFVDILFIGLITLIISSAFIDLLFVNNDFSQMYLYFMLGVLLKNSTNKNF